MRTALALVVVALLAVPGAAAAQPSNDARDAAASLGVRDSEHGSLAGATLEGAVTTDPEEPPTAQICSSTAVGDVWYSVAVPHGTGRMVVRLAGRDLDASISVLRVTSAGLLYVDCDQTDRDHRAGVSFGGSGGDARYLVRIAQNAFDTSGARDFTVTTAPAPRDPSFPGPQLPAAGARGVVDRLANRADTWSAVLHEGTTYRVNLAHGPNRCLRLEIFSPGSSSSEDPDERASCGGYALLTPGPGLGGR